MWKVVRHGTEILKTFPIQMNNLLNLDVNLVFLKSTLAMLFCDNRSHFLKMKIRHSELYLIAYAHN